MLHIYLYILFWSYLATCSDFTVLYDNYVTVFAPELTNKDIDRQNFQNLCVNNE